MAQKPQIATHRALAGATPGLPGLPSMPGGSRISLRARLLLRIIRFVSPNFSGPDGLARAISKDRANGPALPGRGLRKKLDFQETAEGHDRVFHARPKGGASSRLRILYLHGGAYLLDLQAVQWNLIEGLIARTGAEVTTPIYLLAPDHGSEDSYQSVRRCYFKLLATCAAARIVIVADSAGGGLALGLAQRLRDAGEPLPAALVLFSPWLDCALAGPDQPELARADPALTLGFLRQAGELWAGGLATDDPRVSPLFGDLTGLPPMIVFAGSREILASDARRLAALRPETLLREYPEMFHVWPAAGFLPEARRAMDEAVDFIMQNTPQ